jgi:hypothetical protein
MRATAAKARKAPKKAARKGNGKAAKPGNGAGEPAANQQPDPSASTRWFQMLNSLNLPDLYTLLDMVERRIGNKEAAGEDLVAKPPTRAKRMLDISDALATLSHQLDVAADAARANELEPLETTLYQLSEAVKAQGDALQKLCRAEPVDDAGQAESEVVS